MLLSTLGHWVDRDGDPQEHDSEVVEASFEPSITRYSYYLLITDEGRKPPGSVEAVPLHGFPLCRKAALPSCGR